MNVQMARFTVKPNSISEFEQAAKGLFAAVQRSRPKGIIGYTLSRLSDGVTYLGLLELENGVNNPLPELPEGGEFLESLANWTTEVPARDQLSVIGSYRTV